MAGRVLIPAGFVLALSGLWMATVYHHPAGDGPALLVIRVVFGSYMLVSLVLAVRALVRRCYVVHGAWMTRAYALGVVLLGTQAIALIPGSILFGSDDHNLARHRDGRVMGPQPRGGGVRDPPALDPTPTAESVPDPAQSIGGAASTGSEYTWAHAVRTLSGRSIGSFR